MADKNKRDKNGLPDDGAANRPAPGKTRSDARRFGDSRRRLPLAALIVLLALVGVGIYFAWPSIHGTVQTAPTEKVIASSEPEPAEEPELAAQAEPSPALTALSKQVAALGHILAEQRAALERAEANLAAAKAAPPELDLVPVADAMIRLENMEKRLSKGQGTAQTRRAAITRSEEGVSVSAIDLQTLERLDALERSLTAIETSRSAAELDSVITKLADHSEQIAALHHSAKTMEEREAENGRTMIMVLSYTRLSRAAAGAAPFAREAEAFAAAARADGKTSITLDNAMAQLAAHALGGTPTHSDLAVRLNDVALAVIRADVNADDQNWVDATIGRLRRIVTVRRVSGDIAANSLEGQLSALHQAISDGNLAGAVALADALPAKSRPGAENWLRDARARLDVEQALSLLEGEMTERIAAHWLPAARSGE